MNKADEMRTHAENCAELAQHAEKPADKARYNRMEAAWKQLASNEEWLEGTERVWRAGGVKTSSDSEHRNDPRRDALTD